jgi:hypothetical protein
MIIIVSVEKGTYALGAEELHVQVEINRQAGRQVSTAAAGA